MSNRLETIVTRQRSSRLRDVAFVAFVALASFVSLSSIGTAVSAAAGHVAQR